MPIFDTDTEKFAAINFSIGGVSQPNLCALDDDEIDQDDQQVALWLPLGQTPNEAVLSLSKRILAGSTGVIPIVIVPSGGVGRMFGKNVSVIKVDGSGYSQPIPMTLADYDWTTS